MVEQPTVVWNLSASQALKRYCDHVQKDSFKNAQQIQEGISETVDQLPVNPERYPLDKFKRSNPGNYRALEKFSLRIAYWRNEKEVRILQCRHVKRQPKFY